MDEDYHGYEYDYDYYPDDVYDAEPCLEYFGHDDDYGDDDGLHSDIPFVEYDPASDPFDHVDIEIEGADHGEDDSGSGDIEVPIKVGEEDDRDDADLDDEDDGVDGQNESEYDEGSVYEDGEDGGSINLEGGNVEDEDDDDDVEEELVAEEEESLSWYRLSHVNGTFGANGVGEAGDCENNGPKLLCGVEDQDKQLVLKETGGICCLICMELSTCHGEHTICCLPCGHMYGMSCIERWLQQQYPGKCPQCNRLCKLKDVRRLYGSFAVVDEKLEEKIRFLEAKCASLELKQAESDKKKAEWEKKKAEWEKQKAEWRQREVNLLRQILNQHKKEVKHLSIQMLNQLKG